MSIFLPTEQNDIEKTRFRILYFIIALSAFGEAGLIALDIARDRSITNNLIILLCLLAAGFILSTRRISLSAYVAFTPFGVDFIRVTAENGADSHGLPLLFLLVVEVVYFLPTYHALLFVCTLMAAFNGTVILLTPDAELNQIGKLLVVTDAIVIGITAIFITVFRSMKRYFGSLVKQNAHLDELVQERTSDLEAERKRSEQLLHSILPEKIVHRINQGETTPVDRIDNASVLFADLSGFTKLSRTMSADELVSLLNLIFSEMDKLAVQHGLEKIKTIGDAYMVAAGVPDPREDDLVRLANFALELQNLFEQKNKTGRSIGLRVGLHSGPVVAGVIGTRKFMYDLWGETVNIASRMESCGLEGKIQTTDFVRERLKDQFSFVRRGQIEVSGLGKMNAWFLEGTKQSPTDKPIIPSAIDTKRNTEALSSR